VPQVLYFRTGTSSSQAIVGLELGLGSGSALVSFPLVFYYIEEHIRNVYKVETKRNE